MAELTLHELKNSAPEGGFFADREWIWSPEPFRLSKGQKKQLQRLGHPLHRFQQASDEIYRLSSEGRRPDWIASPISKSSRRVVRVIWWLRAQWSLRWILLLQMLLKSLA